MPLKIVVGLLTFLYPFMVYWGLTSFDIRIVFLILLTLLVVRWLSGKGKHDRFVVLFSLLGVLVITLLADMQSSLLFYPVLINLGFLFVFTASLFADQTIIERLARLQQPNLPESGVRYTRKVTQIWCGFFLVNGTVSAATAIWGTNQQWMLYNGFISYLLIGVLFMGEWIVRTFVRR